MLTVLLMRHGQAAADHSSERLLTATGTKEVERFAAQKKLVGDLDRIFTSPLTRAQQTAEIIQEHQRHSFPVRTLECLLPGSKPAELVLALPTSGRVLAISHMPYVSDLMSWFVHGELGKGCVFKTAMVMLLHFAQGAGSGLAQLKKLYCP